MGATAVVEYLESNASKQQVRGSWLPEALSAAARGRRRPQPRTAAHASRACRCSGRSPCARARRATNPRAPAGGQRAGQVLGAAGARAGGGGVHWRPGRRQAAAGRRRQAGRRGLRRPHAAAGGHGGLPFAGPGRPLQPAGCRWTHLLDCWPPSRRSVRAGPVTSLRARPQVACSRGKQAVVAELLQAGATPLRPCLLAACREKYLSIVHLLVGACAAAAVCTRLRCCSSVHAPCNAPLPAL